MTKVGKSAKIGRSSATGQFIQVDKCQPSKSIAGSVLSKPVSKPSSKTDEVLKSVSSIHSEALIRLKNR
jgi:hypothetical protein